jgi:hypothetical protein
LAWEAELERNKVESGRSRATEIRLARLIENFRPLDLEVLHHHGYASARRIGRELLECDDDIIRPINCGIGFYVSDWPRDLDFERAHLAYSRLATWYWLVVASGQTRIQQPQQLPQEILDSPFGEIIADTFETVDGDGQVLLVDQLSRAFERRVSAAPTMLLIQEIMLYGSLNLNIDQAILNRVNQEINRRCLEKLNRIDPGDIFQFESRWDREYSDFQIDRNDYL